MTNEDEWNEQLHAALNRDATRRPQSRFAAGMVGPSHKAIQAIDELVLELLLLRKRLTDDQ